MKDAIKSISKPTYAIVLLVLCCTIAAWANINGSIYTSTGDGITVNANVYPSKNDVYLNGGPQNIHSKGLPDGTYYFLVTDPSGKTKLSQDEQVCRQLDVVGGVVHGYHHDSLCLTDSHLNGTPNAANGGSIPVQLMPYADTPNTGGEYKVWLTPVAAYNVCSNPTFGFCDSNSKTDNFKVQLPSPPPPQCVPGRDIACTVWPIAGVKFYDQNATGVLSATGSGNTYAPVNGIQGWRFKIVSACAGLTAGTPLGGSGGCVIFPDKFTNTTDSNLTTNGGYVGSYTTTTDPNGKFRFDGLTAGDSYGICELFPTSIDANFKWQATPACPNSYPGFTTAADFNGVTTFGPAYSLGSGNLYGVPYPTTYDDLLGPSQHLGLGDAVCNNPAASNPNPSAFLTNVSDVFEFGAPGANFGNRCVNFPAGGLTKGFWSNKNGNSLITKAGGLSYLNGLGLHFDGPNGPIGPFTALSCSNSSLSCFDYWMSGGSNSANSANQLSAQMTAAVLNINLGDKAIKGGFMTAPAATAGTHIYAPGTECAAEAGLDGYATVGCVINEANYAIVQSAITPSGSTTTCNPGGTNALGASVSCRDWQNALQTVLNNFNNNIAGPTPGTGAGIAICGVQYNNTESCSVSVPLTPPAPFVLPLVAPQP